MAQEAHLRDRTLGLQAEGRLAVFRYGDAVRKYTLYGKTLVPKAEQALGSVRGAFRVGKASFMELIDSERTLLELKLGASRAKADIGIHSGLLEELLGAPLVDREQKDRNQE